MKIILAEKVYQANIFCLYEQFQNKNEVNAAFA